MGISDEFPWRYPWPHGGRGVERLTPQPIEFEESVFSEVPGAIRKVVEDEVACDGLHSLGGGRFS